MNDSSPTIEEFSLLLGYVWIVNKGVPLEKQQLRLLLETLFKQGEELSEQIRYPYRIIKDGKDLGVFKSEKYSMGNLFVILTLSPDVLLEEVWENILLGLGVEGLSDSLKIIFKGYTSTESDKYATLSYQFSRLTWLLCNLVKNF